MYIASPIISDKTSIMSNNSSRYDYGNNTRYYDNYPKPDLCESSDYDYICGWFVVTAIEIPFVLILCVLLVLLIMTSKKLRCQVSCCFCKIVMYLYYKSIANAPSDLLLHVLILKIPPFFAII